MGPGGDTRYSILVDDSMEKMTVTVTSTWHRNGEFKVFEGFVQAETKVSEDGSDITQ